MNLSGFVRILNAALMVNPHSEVVVQLGDMTFKITTVVIDPITPGRDPGPGVTLHVHQIDPPRRPEVPLCSGE